VTEAVFVLILFTIWVVALLFCLSLYDSDKANGEAVAGVIILLTVAFCCILTALGASLADRKLSQEEIRSLQDSYPGVMQEMRFDNERSNSGNKEAQETLPQ